MRDAGFSVALDKGVYTPHHDFRRVQCSACGGMFWEQRQRALEFSYCPHCGRRLTRQTKGA